MELAAMELPPMELPPMECVAIVNVRDPWSKRIVSLERQTEGWMKQVEAMAERKIIARPNFALIRKEMGVNGLLKLVYSYRM